MHPPQILDLRFLDVIRFHVYIFLTALSSCILCRAPDRLITLVMHSLVSRGPSSMNNNFNDEILYYQDKDLYISSVFHFVCLDYNQVQTLLPSRLLPKNLKIKIYKQ